MESYRRAVTALELRLDRQQVASPVRVGRCRLARAVDKPAAVVGRHRLAALTLDKEAARKKRPPTAAVGPDKEAENSKVDRLA